MIVGCMAYLGRFLAKMGEKNPLFYQLLKDGTIFKWTPKCQRAFNQFKVYLSQTPLLVSLIEGETLFMYLVVTKAFVSFVICSLKNDKMMPVYYVSHVLTGAETHYNLLEKHIFNLASSNHIFKYTPS